MHATIDPLFSPVTSLVLLDSCQSVEVRNAIDKKHVRSVLPHH